MGKRPPKPPKAGAPTRSQRRGLLALSALMLAALLIMLCRQQPAAPAKCEEELIPLRQMQQYKATQAQADSASAPQDCPKAEKPKKGKRHKAKQAVTATDRPATPRKINEETLATH